MKYIFFAIIFFPICCFAFSLDQKLPDLQEVRAENLFKEIRCVVCAGQSIAESNADIARDLRNLIRQKIKAGLSDQEIENYIAARYGAEILLNPPLGFSTFLLWLAPFIFLGLGIYFVFGRWKKP